MIQFDVADDELFDAQAELLESMRVMIEASIADLKYDKTLECFIVDNSQRKKGLYVVKTEDAQFEAYATDPSETYFTNELVYVNVPQSDFSRKKFILGRKTNLDENASIFQIKQSLANFVGLTTIYEASDSFGYYANDRSGSLAIAHWTNSDDSLLVGDKLSVSFNTTTFLNAYNLVDGDYGLKIDISGYSKPTDDESAQPISATVYVKTEDMFGNSYAYVFPTEQQKTFDISTFSNITSVDISFYQNYKFKDKGGQEVAVDKTIMMPNIVLDNISAQIGFLADELRDDTVFLDTADSLSYTPADTNLNRTLRLNWVHKIDEKYTVINAPSADYNYTIYWYHQSSGAIAALPLNQPDWEKINEQQNDIFTNAITIDGVKQNEKYKAVIQYGSAYFVSNELTFINQNYTQDNINAQTINAEEIASKKLTASSGTIEIADMSMQAISQPKINLHNAYNTLSIGANNQLVVQTGNQQIIETDAIKLYNVSDNKRTNPISVNTAFSQDKVFYYPMTQSALSPWLGTDEHPWNIKANIISGNTIEISETANIKNLYIDGNEAATQQWVQSYVNAQLGIE